MCFRFIFLLIAFFFQWLYLQSQILDECGKGASYHLDICFTHLSMNLVCNASYLKYPYEPQKKAFFVWGNTCKEEWENDFVNIVSPEMVECFERPHHIQHSLHAPGSDRVGRGRDFTPGVPTRHTQSKHTTLHNVPFLKTNILTIVKKIRSRTI